MSADLGSVLRRLWRRVAGSAGLQALGAVATLVTGLAVGAVNGPAAQGEYGLWRSTVDVIIALALFGLPQALVQALNQHRAAPDRLWRGSARYLAGVAALALAAAVAGAPLPGVAGAWSVAALLVAAVGGVGHGLVRSFVLCRGTPAAFGALSALPALALCLTVAASLALDAVTLAAAFAAAGVLTAAVSAWQRRQLAAADDWAVGEPPQWRRVLSGSGHAALQTAVVALQPWATLLLLRGSGASPEALGHFVLAAQLWQAWAVPAGFVAPLLFARVARATGQGRRWSARASRSAVAVLLAGALALAGLLALALPPLVRLGFGPAYDPAGPALVWMALSGPALLLNRLGASQLLGEGRFRAATLQSLLRVPLLLGAFALASRMISPASPDAAATAGALTWCALEWMSLGVLLVLRRGTPAVTPAAPRRGDGSA